MHAFNRSNPSPPLFPTVLFSLLAFTVPTVAENQTTEHRDEYISKNERIENTEMNRYASLQTFLPTTRWRLWYDQPAEKWTEALPVGNGRLGAMVFGGTAQERIQLNEESLWDGYERDATNPEALEALPEVRRLIFEGKNKEAEEIALEKMVGRPGRIKSYQTLGDFMLSFPSNQQHDSYVRYLDLETGITGTVYVSDGVTYRREVFASVPDQLIVVRCSADTPGKINVKATITRPQDAETFCLEDNRLVLRGQIQSPREDTGENAGMRFECHILPVHFGGQTLRSDNEIEITGADDVIFLISAATDFKGRQPEVLCRTWIENGAKSYDELRANHVADHRKLFRRIDLDLGESENAHLPTDARLARVAQGESDPELVALYFQYGRYLLMGSSRPGCLPANLQGIWNEHINAPWNSDYHTNINVQMNYWIAEVGNLSECHLPLIDFMESLVPSGTRTAQKHYGAGGWVVHHISDIFGFTVPADGIWGIWPMGAAWLCQHPYEHFLFTGDRDFLKERAYPLMKGAAQFLLDFLVEDAQGRLVTNPSYSPENTFVKPDGSKAMLSYASTMDLMIIHDLFTNCIEAAQILNTDEDFRVKLENALKRLPPIQISPKTGRLQEWIEDYEDAEPGHRHMSHFFGLHPGKQITPRGTPELVEALRKSLDYRLSHGGGHTGWSRAWIINFWARLEEPQNAFENVQALLAKSTLPNLFDDHPPFQIDGNFGGAAGIAEMLLQSHTGEIHLLPALPEAWHSGYFRGLRARGGFEMDASWEKGEITTATVRSTQNIPCRIRYKRPLVLSSGDTPVPVRTIEENVLEFDTQAGKEYTIRPVS